MKIQIEQIRYELTWRIRHQVMYPDEPFDMIKLPEDPDGMHFGLYEGEWLTAVVSLFENGKVFQFRKFATLTAKQGMGYGSALLEYIIAYCREQGAEKLWCNARVSAEGFYAKFGFRPVGEVFVQHGLDFVQMELDMRSDADLNKVD